MPVPPTTSVPGADSHALPGSTVISVPSSSFAPSVTPFPASTCFAGTSPDTSWVVYTSIVQRMNDGPQSQLEHFGTRSALTSQWLFQLYLALECDLWIGTRNSNWNRLIDEMRCGSQLEPVNGPLHADEATALQLQHSRATALTQRRSNLL